jgi:hypothetical protein
MERRPSREEIRHLVRDLLREAGLRDGDAAKAPTASRPVRAPRPETTAGERGSLSERVRRALKNGAAVEVAMAGERDLNAFAQQVALCALERDLLGAIAANRVRFKIAGPTRGVAAPAGAPGAPPAAAAPRDKTAVFRWDKGVLNEARIAEIAKTHGRLVLGPKGVLTPLARDRARALKLEIERRKS